MSRKLSYPEVVSAKVTIRCKKLIKEHNIPIRAVIEAGLNQILSQKHLLEWEIKEINKEINQVKVDLISLEMERDELQCKLKSLHSDEDSV